MERDVNLIVISDDNNKESRELAEKIPESLSLSCTSIPIQRVQHVLPGIRATPAVGVLIWANDLQEFITDVGALAEYFKNQVEYESAVDRALELEYQLALIELGV